MFSIIHKNKRKKTFISPSSHSINNRLCTKYELLINIVFVLMPNKIYSFHSFKVINSKILAYWSRKCTQLQNILKILEITKTKKNEKELNRKKKSTKKGKWEEEADPFKKVLMFQYDNYCNYQKKIK